MHAPESFNSVDCYNVWLAFVVINVWQEQATPEAQPEEKKEEKKEEKAEEKPTEEKKEPPPPPPPFVLFVDLHCVGCAKKIEKSVMRIRGNTNQY